MFELKLVKNGVLKYKRICQVQGLVFIPVGFLGTSSEVIMMKNHLFTAIKHVKGNLWLYIFNLCTNQCLSYPIKICSYVIVIIMLYPTNILRDPGHEMRTKYLNRDIVTEYFYAYWFDRDNYFRLNFYRWKRFTIYIKYHSFNCHWFKSISNLISWTDFQ